MTARRTPTLALLLVFLSGTPAAPGAPAAPRMPNALEPEPVPQDTDALDEALAGAGLTRSDLGFEPRGWWSGFPADIPFKLRHFDDLLAEPLAVVPWTRALGAAARTLLDPAAAESKGSRGAGWLYSAAHALGVQPRLGTLRAYSANMTATATPLNEAVLAAYRQAGRPTEFVTFGESSPYPELEQGLAAAVAALPPEISGLLGRLVLDLLEARRWADLAWRRVPLQLRAQVAARLDIGREEVDALDYSPAFDDVAKLWDEPSLWYAGLKTIEALDRARADLAPLLPEAGATLNGFAFDHDTPLGRIVVRGSGTDQVDLRGAGALLVVDLGGDDTWIGRVAAAGPTLPLAAMLDMGGDDSYRATSPAQGSGITGVGVLLDAAGDDAYDAQASLSQGAGQFGLGALIDVAGADRYTARHSAQGCAYFGVGLLMDVAGADTYTAWSESQGFGGVAGVGTLADRSGNDAYLLVPDPGITGRPSYHSEFTISVSNGQGCAMGRRGDGADGHSWAGGLGALLDVDGSDTYRAGNWAQGTGYWFGTGLLWDGAGDDEYVANGWASGSGAHFCIGAVIDEGGDDLHQVDQDWGPAFGHDFAVVLLVNEGGDDHYVCGQSGMAWGVNRSIVGLFDVGGDDRYDFAQPDHAPGTAVFSDRYVQIDGPSLYWTEALSVSVFLDIGGTDVYTSAGGDGGAARDDGRWFGTDVERNRAVRNHSIGVDRAAGRLDLTRPHPVRRGR